VAPRYDIPRAAPEPLRQVQLFVNSVDLHNGVEWLPDWLDARGLGGAVARATELREALRLLLRANNGDPIDPTALELVNSAAVRVRPELDREGRLRFATDGDGLDEIVAIVLGATRDGSWRRLKACPTCCWSFYDGSPNRSATWCSMQLCGNRKKTRAYRSRHRGRAAS
jgi:predicted RNA-binding Zn ribbon-like protein